MRSFVIGMGIIASALACGSTSQSSTTVPASGGTQQTANAGSGGQSLTISLGSGATTSRAGRGGAEDWQQRTEHCTSRGAGVELGSGSAACAERETKPCAPEGWTTPQDLLYLQVSDIVGSCGGLPVESKLEVDFADGCATQLVPSISGPGDDAALLDCIGQTLGAYHFACADALACIGLQNSTVR